MPERVYPVIIDDLTPVKPVCGLVVLRRVSHNPSIDLSPDVRRALLDAARALEETPDA